MSVDRPYLYGLLFSVIFLIGGCATVGTGQPRIGPYITSTYPSPGDFNISRYTDIRIRFSEEMEDISFELIESGQRVDGSGRWADSKTMFIFQPYDPLKARKTYQGILRDGKSVKEENLTGVPFIWMFTTGN